MKLRAIIPFSIFLITYACAQNGPTPVTTPTVVLSWTQSTGAARNCVYRGAAAGQYALPAVFCSATPVTAWTDTTVVRGQTYHYAVTAVSGGTNPAESAYSGDGVAVVPVVSVPGAPTAVVVVVK